MMSSRSLQALLASGLLTTCLVGLLHLMGRGYSAGYLRASGLPFEFMRLTKADWPLPAPLPRRRWIATRAEPQGSPSHVTVRRQDVPPGVGRRRALPSPSV